MDELNRDETFEIAEGLELRIERGGGCARATLTGEIADTIEHAPLVELDADSLIFNLEGVDRITSYGIREWVKLLDELEVDYYCFERCRPALVAQFNMVFEFRGDGEIVSLYLPYLCSSCGEESQRLVDLRESYAELSDFEVPEQQCPECGEPAEFDDLPELYLECVSDQRPPSPPRAVRRMLDGEVETESESPESDGESRPFRMRKEVVGDMTVLWGSGTFDDRTHIRRLTEGLESPVVVVCSEIDAIEAEPFGEFVETLETCLLARVQPRHLESLVDHEALREAVWPVTTRTTAECTDCGWSAIQEIELASATDSDSPDVARGCPECFGDLEAQIGEDDLELFARFEPEPPPPEVASYLAHRESPPGTAGAGDVERVRGERFGAYELHDQIGSGGMADIFLATRSGPAGFERKVVIKRLRLERSAAPETIDSFKQEAKIAAGLRHSNVVQVTDFGHTNQFYYMAMEYVDGPDLQDVLQETWSRRLEMPVRHAVFLAARVAAGLRAAHTMTDEEGRETPIVHRDVSPHNILIAAHGMPKLTDFGIARVASELERASTNTVRGKVDYLAPEMIYPKLGSVDHRADLFSLGTVLFQCLTNQRPFAERDRQATMKAIVQSPPPDLSAVRPEVPDELDDAFRRSVAKRPSDRFDDTLVLQEVLEDVLEELGAVTAREFGDWVSDLMQAERKSARQG